MTSLLHNQLSKEIVKREFYREVLKGDPKREALPTYYEMKEIVERKWEQDEIFAEKNQLLITEKER